MRPDPDVEAVLFDLDHTLLDGDAAWRCGIDALLGRCPHVDAEAAFKAWDVACEEHFDRYLRAEISLDECRVARIRSWAEQLCVAVEPGDELAWFDDYSVGYRAGWVPFADTHESLNQLEGFRLGVITNGEGVQQRAKLDALQLEVQFEVVIASGDVGFAKPDPRIFMLAAQQLDLAPERCIFVGDKRDVDALGAIAAGMRGVWLNRRMLPAPDALVPQITSLAALPALLAG